MFEVFHRQCQITALDDGGPIDILSLWGSRYSDTGHNMREMKIRTTRTQKASDIVDRNPKPSNDTLEILGARKDIQPGSHSSSFKFAAITSFYMK